MNAINGRKLGIAAVFAAALSFAGLAWADTQPTPEGDSGRVGWHAEMLQKFDINHDGKLDESERQAMREQFKARREARRQELLPRFDTNHDGKLDPAERQAMRQELGAERFKALDTNGDGSLSLAEFQAGHSKHMGFGAKPGAVNGQ